MIPWMYRYFHANSLYNAHKGDIQAIENFKKDLLKGLQVKVSGSHTELYKRCEKLVTNASRRFHHNENLLVRKEGVLCRTEVFEKAWVERHALWLTLNASELDNNEDLPLFSRDVHCGSQKQKRV
jgi:hypothetical protein